MGASKTPKKGRSAKLNLDDVSGYRRQLGENQSAFWQRFGVTQSGGSRYESGRNMPRPVRILVSLFAAGKIADDDLKVAAGGKAKRGQTDA